MEIVNNIVHWLEGKKALIGSILGVIISYLVTEGTITASMGTMLQSLIAMITTGSLAIGATQKYKDFKLGKAK